MTSNAATAFPGAPDIGTTTQVYRIFIKASPQAVTWRMAVDPELSKEGFTRLTYEIMEGRPGVSRLSVFHDVTGKPGYAAMIARDQQGPGRSAGWAWILSDLKSMLETGAAMA